MAEKVKLNSVQIVERFYPRRTNNIFEIDQEAVNNYKLNLANLPPIIVSKDYTLIDGYHRYLAYRDTGRDEIEAEILDIPEVDYLTTAIKLNTSHGVQLSRKQKIHWAQILCQDGKAVGDIASLLAVNEDYVEDWTRDIRAKQKDERNQRILELYLKCWTEEEIAKEVGLSRPGVEKLILIQKGEITPKYQNPPSSFKPYTLLQFQSPDDRFGKQYPGRMPGQVVEHLLWYYTEPFDVVLDPMAGGGTTRDVCRAMYRRYQVYDIAKDESKDIEYHDVVDGVPCKPYFPPKLIILDPPYWSQKKGNYESSDTNLANMPLDAFYVAVKKIVKECADLLVVGGYLAFIISPSQSNKIVYDHIFPVKENMETYLKYEMRFIVPYTTQQVSGADIKQATKGKYPLKLFRDLLVYRKCNKD